MIIGICGYATSGKDTVAERLIEEGVVSKRYAFADPLKELVNALFDWDERHAFGDLKEIEIDVEITDVGVENFTKIYESYTLHNYLPVFDCLDLTMKIFKLKYNHEKNVFYGKISPRVAYQLFGTEVGRVHIHKNVWVMISPNDDVVIPDIRFLNEEEWVNERDGILIRVIRDNIKYVAQHESEMYVEQFEPHYTIINNGTLDELNLKIGEIIKCLINKKS